MAVSFAKLCSKWNEAITNNGLHMAYFKHRTAYADHNLNMHTYNYCIVGEAYKFPEKSEHMDVPSYADPDSLDYCETCTHMAQRFLNISENAKDSYNICGKYEKSQKDYDRTVEDFINHWNEKHEREHE